MAWGPVFGVVSVLVLQLLLSPGQAEQGRIIAGVKAARHSCQNSVQDGRTFEDKILQLLLQIGSDQFLADKPICAPLGWSPCRYPA